MKTQIIYITDRELQLGFGFLGHLMLTRAKLELFVRSNYLL